MLARQQVCGRGLLSTVLNFYYSTMASGGEGEGVNLPAGASLGFDSETGEKFTFFFGRDCVFSQWYGAEFRVEEVDYSCAEHYMMHQKASQCSRLNLYL